MAAQVAFFNSVAVAGFGRDHVTGMALEALVGFDISQVQNLDSEAKFGIGDTVATFGDFDLAVRKELVDESALLLGGVGSFDDLLSQLTGNDGSEPTPGQLAESGWDQSLADFGSIEFGTSDGSVATAFDDATLAAALAAFGLAGLGANAPVDQLDQPQ